MFIGLSSLITLALALLTVFFWFHRNLLKV